MERSIFQILLIGAILFNLSNLSIAQSKFSVEIGPSYVINLSHHGDAQKLDNARGINLGINYQLNQKTQLNLLFGYQKFMFENQSWEFGPKSYILYDILYPILNSEDISFYNLILSFRAYFNQKGIRPYIMFGIGTHIIKGGVNFNDKQAINNSNDVIIPASDQSSTYTRMYMAIGPGVSLPLSSKFAIIINSAVSVSTEEKYIFLPLSVLLNYNF